MFPGHFPKDPCIFPYILLMTVQYVTLVPVDYSAFLCDVVLVLGGHQEVLNGAASLEMDLGPYLATNVLEGFASPLGVWYHYVDVVMVVAAVVVVGDMVVVLGLGNAMSMVAVDWQAVLSPNGILTPK